MDARTSKQHNCRHWGNVALPRHIHSSSTGIHKLSQLHLNCDYREIQLLKGWFSHCCLMSCHYSWQAFWRKMSYNINEKASVFQQWLPVPKGKPIFRATWFLLGLSHQNKALLRPKDTILTKTTTTDWCYTPHSGTLQGQLSVWHWTSLQTIKFTCKQKESEGSSKQRPWDQLIINNLTSAPTKRK